MAWSHTTHTHREHTCLNHTQKKHLWHITFYFLLVRAQFVRVLQLILKESMLLLFLKRKELLMLGIFYYFSLYLIHTHITLRQFSENISEKSINLMYYSKHLNWKYIKQLCPTFAASFYEFASKHSWDTFNTINFENKEINVFFFTC